MIATMPGDLASKFINKLTTAPCGVGTEIACRIRGDSVVLTIPFAQALAEEIVDSIRGDPVDFNITFANVLAKEFFEGSLCDGTFQDFAEFFANAKPHAL